MLEDLFNDLLTLNKIGDLHASLTFRAGQEINLVNLLDQLGSVFPVFLRGTLRFYDGVDQAMYGREVDTKDLVMVATLFECLDHSLLFGLSSQKRQQNGKEYPLNPRR